MLADCFINTPSSPTWPRRLNKRSLLKPLGVMVLVRMLKQSVHFSSPSHQCISIGRWFVSSLQRSHALLPLSLWSLGANF